MYSCKYCNKEYTSLSSLNKHQKTAKFCLELQKKEAKSQGKKIKLDINKVHICSYCSKYFTVKSVLQTHILTCKDKKCQEEIQLKEKADRADILEKENNELKLKLEFERSQNIKLEKRLTELLNRPTTVYNDNSTNEYNSKNQYNIQFNQMLSGLSALNKLNMDDSFKKEITKEMIDKYDYANITSEISNSLVNVIKPFAFFSDLSRKVLVVKNDENSHEKIVLEQFIDRCFNLSRDELLKYIELIKDIVDEKANDDTLEDETYFKFKPAYIKIKDYILKNDVSKFSDKTIPNPLKEMIFISTHIIEQISKHPKLVI